MTGGLQRLPLDIADEPRVVARAVTLDDDDQLAAGRRARDGNVERQVARGEMQHRGVLCFERDTLPAGVRDLQHEATLGRVDAVVAILVGAELLDRAVDAEQLARDPARLVGRELGAPQREAFERVLGLHPWEFRGVRQGYGAVRVGKRESRARPR